MRYRILATDYTTREVGQEAKEEDAIRVIDNLIDVFQEGTFRVEYVSSGEPVYMVTAENGYHKDIWHWEV